MIQGHSIRKSHALTFMGMAFVFFSGTVIWFVCHAEWEIRAAVTDRKGNSATYIMDASHQPIWNPPSAPGPEEFATNFHGLSKDQILGISVVLNWEHVFFDVFAFWFLWAIIFAPLPLVFFRDDPWLGVIGRMTGSMTASGFICILLWFIFGGWGPPAPIMFGFLGCGLGLLWSLVFLRNKTRRQFIADSE